jgi:hypothetical protein
MRTLKVCLFLALACSYSAAHAQVLQGYHRTACSIENGVNAVWGCTAGAKQILLAHDGNRRLSI